MYRGTTPTIKLRVNTTIDLTQIEVLWITLKNTLHSLTIEKDSCEISDERKTISFTLSQEETLAFGAGEVELQIRFLIGGLAYASNVKKLTMLRILKDGVIGE